MSNLNEKIHQDNEEEEETNPRSRASNRDDFQCNICLDTAKEAVVSLCGHMFCWPCLLQWLDMKPDDSQTCPVCKSAINKDNVVPIYGRNSDYKDPREKYPPRPSGQRTEPVNNQGNNPFAMEGSGFQMSFGIGGFPIGLLSTTFNFGPTSRPQSSQNGQINNEDIFYSRLFVCLAIVLIFWLISS